MSALAVFEYSAVALRGNRIGAVTVTMPEATRLTLVTATATCFGGLFGFNDTGTTPAQTAVTYEAQSVAVSIS